MKTLSLSALCIAMISLASCSNKMYESLYEPQYEVNEITYTKTLYYSHIEVYNENGKLVNVHESDTSDNKSIVSVDNHCIKFSNSQYQYPETYTIISNLLSKEVNVHDIVKTKKEFEPTILYSIDGTLYIHSNKNCSKLQSYLNNKNLSNFVNLKSYKCENEKEYSHILNELLNEHKKCKECMK